MNEITLRQIPKRTYHQLRMLAKKNRTSINKTILSLIHKSLGLEERTSRMRDLGDIAGTWSDEEFREFSLLMKDFEKIDKEVWIFGI